MALAVEEDEAPKVSALRIEQERTRMGLFSLSRSLGGATTIEVDAQQVRREHSGPCGA